MRGKENLKTDTIMKSRITPAYAGKSSTVSESLLIIEDHPRVCGEK